MNHSYSGELLVVGLLELGKDSWKILEFLREHFPGQ